MSARAATMRRPSKMIRSGSIAHRRESNFVQRKMSMATHFRNLSVGQIDSNDVFADEDRFSRFKKALCFFRTPKDDPLTPTELESKILKLHRCCLTHNVDTYKLHLDRLKGLGILEEILERVNGSLEWIRRRQAKRSMKVFDNLIFILVPTKYELVIESMFAFYTEGNIWEMEYLCVDLLRKLLNHSKNCGEAVSAILDIVDSACMTNLKVAKQIVKVLYQVLDDFPWPTISETLIKRLLATYHASMLPQDENESQSYVPLRKGLEVCVRNVLQNLSNSGIRSMMKPMLEWVSQDSIQEDVLLDFGNLLEFAAILHETELYPECLSDDIFPLVLKLIASENILHSLLGNRVFQHLLDRKDNRLQFESPRIFFKDTHFNIVIEDYHSEDKAFIKKYREFIYESLLSSIMNHGDNKVNLENTYTSIALMVVEVPCGFTAAVVVCLAMAIQEWTLANEEIELEKSNRLHATVVAIISLVCWVHKASVFYEYINYVIQGRATVAPHLNPPLLVSYDYAQHHILWNKPELFFEDWEARYGLWKCFRTDGTQTLKPYNS